jgi:Bcl-2 family protein
MTNPTRTIFTPEVIFTSSDEFAPPTTLLKAQQSQRSAAKRKFSFPATLHSSSLLSDSNPIGRTTRRLSNVSDRVTDRVRKLSTAMGWHQSPSKAILIEQGKFLITLYIRFRLKRSGVLKKKIGLQKMQRNLLIGADVKDVFIALKEVSLVTGESVTDD